MSEHSGICSTRQGSEKCNCGAFASDADIPHWVVFLDEAAAELAAPLTHCPRCRQRIADDGWCPCDDPRDDDYDY